MATKYKAKTTPTEKSVDSYLDGVDPETKRDDCRAISKIMADVSKEPATMWGPAIIGFGFKHYEYESGHSGDMCLVGFAPRKQNIVLYLTGIVGNHDAELKKLGKFKVGGGCIYINKLEDIDTGVLKKLIKSSLDWHASQTNDVSRQSKKPKTKKPKTKSVR
jgi:hypothetical protein